MTASDYEAEAVEALNGTQRHTGLGIYEGDPPNLERAQALATLEVAKQVRRVADAMEREQKPADPCPTCAHAPYAKPLDVALIERALVANEWNGRYIGNSCPDCRNDITAGHEETCGIARALAELRRWKEQQP